MDPGRSNVASPKYGTSGSRFIPWFPSAVATLYSACGAPEMQQRRDSFQSSVLPRDRLHVLPNAPSIVFWPRTLLSSARRHVSPLFAPDLISSSRLPSLLVSSTVDVPSS